MALTSPGLEIQVIDESTYLPSAQATVPLILLATASNKLFNNSLTTGTIKANAAKLDAVSSQRELITKYGTPKFQTSSIGTQLHGDERNEYGLMAAYSALGLGNRAYIIRADIDLDELEGSTSRPTGEPADGTYWLNTNGTDWGIFEWSASTRTFSKKIPILVTGTNISGGAPISAFGNVGEYGVVLSTSTTEIKYFYKGLDYYTTDPAISSWAELGSENWQKMHITLMGSVSNPSLTIGHQISVNGTQITFSGTTIESLANQINTNSPAIDGIKARVINGKLSFIVTDSSKGNTEFPNGMLTIANVSGTALTDLGIAAGNYFAPKLHSSTFAGVPAWSSFDTMPRPSGSVWFKTSATGDGLDLIVSEYEGSTGSWQPVAVPVYKNEPAALFGLDSTGGGDNIATNVIYAANDFNNQRRANLQLFKRKTSGDVTITSATLGATPFSVGNQFTVAVSQSNTVNYVAYTVKLTSTAVSDFVSAIQALNIPNLSCTLNTVTAGSAFTVTLTHRAGGMIHLTDVIGNAISTANFASSTVDYPMPLPAGEIKNQFNFNNAVEMLNTGVTVTVTGQSELIEINPLVAKDIIIPTGLGELIAANQYFHMYQTSNPANYMKGIVNSYNTASGFFAFTPRESGGSGTFSNWTITTKSENYTISETVPSNPKTGDRWLNSVTGQEYMYQVSEGAGDGDGPWKATNWRLPDPAGNADNFFASLPADPLVGDKWLNSTNGRLYSYYDGKWNEVWSSGNRNIGVTVTGFEPLTYTFSASAPVTDPVDGAIWYYSSAATVDIMVNTETGWKGYRNGGVDARGYNLANTDANGVIATASQPTTQSNGTSPIVAGDIWLDTGDLINYPKLYRYNGTTWDLIDNTDQVGSNGILFADARWGTSGDVDPSMDSLPAIGGTGGLINSNYLDLDAPDYRLYPRGMLLFNLRRSGFSVKRYKKNYFNSVSFPSVGPNVIGLPAALPTQKDAWVTASGLKDNGSMYAGPKAQRNMVVSALKAAVDSNVTVREDQYEFNLIACPGYPELIPNMVSLNNDRVNTAFVIGDTPMSLAPSITNIVQWSNNSNGDGLATASEYMGVFYPAGQASDLEGDTVVVPPSHMILRTMMRSDNLSFPWFAPAGARRGLIDNATNIGYIDATTNEFVRFGVSKSLRDTLYENKINPLTVLPGTGLLNYGQKTRYPLTSALDRINVSRLIVYIRKALQPLANNFLFEPNDKITRDQIKQSIEGLMNDLVAKRGIYDYLVVCDDSNNDSARISRNELYVDIAIAPVRTVEFIYIPLRIRNPGQV